MENYDSKQPSTILFMIVSNREYGRTMEMVLFLLISFDFNHLVTLTEILNTRKKSEVDLIYPVFFTMHILITHLPPEKVV